MWTRKSSIVSLFIHINVPTEMLKWKLKRCSFNNFRNQKTRKLIIVWENPISRYNSRSESDVFFLQTLSFLLNVSTDEKNSN